MRVPHSQFKLSLPSTWTTIDSFGDSVTEAIRSGDDLSHDALMRLESRTFSGHLSAKDAADLTLGRLLTSQPGCRLTQAIDRDTPGASQSVRVVVDEKNSPELASAYVLIAEPPEDVRHRVVPTLTLQWALADADILRPEFDHVINSFRFTPPANSLAD